MNSKKVSVPGGTSSLGKQNNNVKKSMNKIHLIKPIKKRNYFHNYLTISWDVTLTADYQNPAEALRKLSLKPKALLTSFIDPNENKRRQRMYNLAVKVKVHEKELKYLIDKFNIVNDNKAFINEYQARVIITEMLWGNQIFLHPYCPEIQCIKYYEECLRESFKQIVDTFENPNDIEILQSPSYIRINTLAMSIDDCLTAFQKEGWILLPSAKSYSEYLQTLSNLGKKEFIRDFHISELLAFPPRTDFYNHPGYLRGKFAYQDKGSCLSSFLLNPKPDSVVVDMFAAPGLTTNHLANIMENSGKIYAIDHHPDRFNRLMNYIELTELTNVVAINNDYKNIVIAKEDVKYILLDHTSSYSGTFYFCGTKTGGNQRPKIFNTFLKNMKVKQSNALKHTLQTYPNVKRVIYTVNSLYPDECEMVVQEALQAVGNSYTLLNVKEMLWDQWQSMSPPDIPETQNCLRIIPEVDLCQGYFIAVFERDFDVPVPKYQNPTKKSSPTLVDDKQVPVAQTKVINPMHEAKVDAVKGVPSMKAKIEPKITQIDDYKQRQLMILQERMQKAQEKKMEILAKKRATENQKLLRWENPKLKNKFQSPSSSLSTAKSTPSLVTYSNKNLMVNQGDRNASLESQLNRNQNVYSHSQSNESMDTREESSEYQNIFSQSQSDNSQDLNQKFNKYQNVFSQTQSSEPESGDLQSESNQNSNLLSQSRSAERSKMYYKLNEQQSIFQRLFKPSPKLQNVFAPSSERQNLPTPSSERKNVFTPFNERQNVFAASNERQNVFTPSSERHNIFSPSSERLNVFSPTSERQNVFSPSSERQNVFTQSSEKASIFQRLFKPAGEQPNIFSPSSERQGVFTSTSEHQNVFAPTNVFESSNERYTVPKPTVERQNVFTPLNERSNVFAASAKQQDSFSDGQSYQNQNAFSSSLHGQTSSTYQQSQFNRSSTSYPILERIIEKTHNQLWP